MSLSPEISPAAIGSDPLAAYEYELPQELVAQTPARRRVMARLLVLGRGSGEMSHEGIWRLPRLLDAGDLLVLNNTKVVPARMWAYKPTGGRVEVLLLSPGTPVRRGPDGSEDHQVLLRAHRALHEGQVLTLAGPGDAGKDDGTQRGESLTLLQKGDKGRWLVSLEGSGLRVAARYGDVPLPPYIRRPDGPGQDDAQRYQTVYADQPGAVAAPTAGLHFSPELLRALQRRGVEIARLTLHVGYGTFAEPSAKDLAAGRLHAEWVRVGDEVSQAVARTKQHGGRVIAVGTTAMRALEWRAKDGGVQPGEGWCDLLINEGHEFKVADGMLTNFHLPRTTLLMLVAALAGREPVLAAYREAVKRSYRFYSYGDAMLIV